MDILNNATDNILFFRKGHAQHNHKEAIDFNCPMKNDIVDCEELDSYLKQRYPKLKFKIITILFCTQCFDIHKIYKSSSDNIIIYNKALLHIEIDTLNQILDETIKALTG
jgi:hypothetical protein